MGSKNHHHHPLHYQFYQKNPQIHHRSTFLPMLCSRPSIKDVSLPQCRGQARSFSNDPQSPRIGFAGQVKRHNKIAGLPTSHGFSLTPKSTKAAANPNTNTIYSSPAVKYSKLKRLFSSKNMSTAATSMVTPTAFSCGSRTQPQPQPQLQPLVTINTNTNSSDLPRKEKYRNETSVAISIENMDPPLPVIKRVHKSEEDSQVDSLWKRRSGGTALRSLQLQQIHPPRHQLQVTGV